MAEGIAKLSTCALQHPARSGLVFDCQNLRDRIHREAVDATQSQCIYLNQVKVLVDELPERFLLLRILNSLIRPLMAAGKGIKIQIEFLTESLSIHFPHAAIPSDDKQPGTESRTGHVAGQSAIGTEHDILSKFECTVVISYISMAPGIDTPLVTTEET